MLTADDLDAFEADNEKAFTAAREFVKRAESGLPPDRWASSEMMLEVAKGINAQFQIMAMQTEAIEEMLAETAERQQDAMSMGEPK